MPVRPAFEKKTESLGTLGIHKDYAEITEVPVRDCMCIPNRDPNPLPNQDPKS